MNPKQYELEVSLEEVQVGDALGCLVHSILFQRQLGPVFPHEEQLGGGLAMIPLTFCRVGQDDDAVNAKVAKEIAGFCTALSKVDRSSKIGQVFTLQLRFFSEQAAGGKKFEWERWLISVKIEARVGKTDIHQALLKCLQQINDASDAALEENYIPHSDQHHEFQIAHEVGGSTFMDTVGNFLSYLTYR